MSEHIIPANADLTNRGGAPVPSPPDDAPPPRTADPERGCAAGVLPWIALKPLKPAPSDATPPAAVVATGRPPARTTRHHRADRSRRASKGDADGDDPAAARLREIARLWNRTPCPPRNWDVYEMNAIKVARWQAGLRDPVNGIAEFDAWLRMPRTTLQRGTAPRPTTLGVDGGRS